MLNLANLLGHILTSLGLLVGTHLFRNVLAVCDWNINTVIDRNLPAVWNLSLLLNIFAHVVWIVPAGGWVIHPHFVVSTSLPVLLTHLFTSLVAFCLSVALLAAVALLLVYGVALSLLYSVALFPLHGVADLLVDSATFVYVLSVADVLLRLHVFRVPDGGVLRSAGDGGGGGPLRIAVTATAATPAVSILGGRQA